jgi:predicted nucleotidyltransferase
MIERIAPKYIPHAETGVPIRLAPYVRTAVLVKAQEAQVVLTLVQNTPFIGQRSEDDFAQNNIEYNKKLRRIAKQVIAPELVAYANEKGVSQYCAIVYGSLSRGLVRHPDHPDKSDIDTALVVDDQTVISREEKEIFEEKLRGIGSSLGVPIGCRIHTLSRAKQMCGQLARTYLEGSAYLLADQNDMWQKLYDMGITAATFTQFGQAERRTIRKLLEAIIDQRFEDAKTRFYRSIEPKSHLLDFLEKNGIFGKDSLSYALELYSLIKVDT